MAIQPNEQKRKRKKEMSLIFRCTIMLVFLFFPGCFSLSPAFSHNGHFSLLGFFCAKNTICVFAFCGIIHGAKFIETFYLTMVTGYKNRTRDANDIANNIQYLDWNHFHKLPRYATRSTFLDELNATTQSVEKVRISPLIRFIA